MKNFFRIFISFISAFVFANFVHPVSAVGFALIVPICFMEYWIFKELDKISKDIEEIKKNNVSK